MDFKVVDLDHPNRGYRMIGSVENIDSVGRVALTVSQFGRVELHLPYPKHEWLRAFYTLRSLDSGLIKDTSVQAFVDNEVITFVDKCSVQSRCCHVGLTKAHLEKLKARTLVTALLDRYCEHFPVSMLDEENLILRNFLQMLCLLLIVRIPYGEHSNSDYVYNVRYATNLIRSFGLVTIETILKDYDD